jgi:hypothetical protein
MFLNPPCFLFVRQQKGSKKCLIYMSYSAGFSATGATLSLAPCTTKLGCFT